MKKEVTEKKIKTFCDVCGREIFEEQIKVSNFVLGDIKYMLPSEEVELRAYARLSKGKKDVCVFCLQEAINKTLKELYK